jgi:3'-phosphoadenosine 5'-phosphosulfate sulfotransferase (PAPS reductase)/FAD synthetase
MVTDLFFNDRTGYALLSGGKDSTLAAYEMHLQGRLAGVIYIDTTIGLRETKDYVISLSQRYGWKLYITQGYRTYEKYILKGGFPHYNQHNMVMHVLKADAILTFSKSSSPAQTLIENGVEWVW